MNIKVISVCTLSFIIGLNICGCTNENKAEKNASGEETVFMGEENIEPTPEIIYKTLIVDENREIYTYEDMEYDLNLLEQAYRNIARLDIIGETADGRKLYDLVIGDDSAQQAVIIHGSIHAREYITSKLVMKQAAYYLWNLNNGSGEYKGIPYSDLFEGTAVHIIPMVNPDGVSISQLGTNGINKPETLERIQNIAASEGRMADSDYLTQWKANSEGVDLNRNFDAMWDEFQGAGAPASDRYKGTAPGCTAEAAALINLTQSTDVVRTLSYHTFGEVIYWYFGQSGDLYNETLAFANDISAVTGYPTDSNYGSLDPAGYKDWAIESLGIPSLTVEVGHGSNPVPNTQFENIWNENKDVWAAVLYNAKN